MSNSKDLSLLAWAGWQAYMPYDWRPLQIDDEKNKGTMILGNSNVPNSQIKWWRTGNKFNPEKWSLKRTKKLPYNSFLMGGESNHFTSLSPFQRFEGHETTPKGVWYGYSSKTHLLIEIVANVSEDKKTKSCLERIVIPSLKATNGSAFTTWSVFDSSFISLPGYKLVRKRLGLGDLCLLLENKKGNAMHLRQVYPAELALSRMDKAKWMNDLPFKDGKRVYRDMGSEDFSLSGMNCIIQYAKKSLPFPLGILGSKECTTGLVHDVRNDRLLIARMESSAQTTKNIVCDLLKNMNVSKKNGKPA